MAFEKKESKIFNKKNVIGLIIVFVMVSSILAVWQGSYSSEEKYNGFKFKSTFDYNYGTKQVFGKINGKWVAFNYHPTTLELINITPYVIPTLKNSKMVYITFNPKDKFVMDIELARVNIGNSLLEEFNIYPFIGIDFADVNIGVNTTHAYSAFPQISCGNATQLVPVVYLQSTKNSEAANKTSIVQEENCIYISADEGYDFVALIDRIRYGLYGVMK